MSRNIWKLLWLGRPCRNLDKLDVWAITNHRSFNNSKCWTLHLEWGNPDYMCRLGNKRLERGSVEKDLGVLAT